MFKWNELKSDLPEFVCFKPYKGECSNLSKAYPEMDYKKSFKPYKGECSNKV